MTIVKRRGTMRKERKNYKRKVTSMGTDGKDGDESM
jgi:hypothetical protein